MMENAKSRGCLVEGCMRSSSSRIMSHSINGMLTSDMKKAESRHPQYVPSTLNVLITVAS